MKRLAILAALMMLGGCGEYSDGQRVGTIQKFSRKGLISKTWEGEILLGGLKRKRTSTSDGGTTTSMVANVWEFTVEDPALIDKTRALMERGEPVKAHYRQEYLTHPWRTETGIFGPYFLTRIEAAE